MASIAYGPGAQFSVGGASAASGYSASTAAADKVRSMTLAQASYTDNASTVFVESFTNLTSWSLGANPIQVSGNKCYAGATQGGGSGANHSFAVASGENCKAVFIVDYTSPAVSGGIIVGFSSDAAGATPTAGGATARGMYFQAGTMKYMDKGTATMLNGTITAGVYIVTAIADQQYLTFTARKTDGSVEYRARFARAGFTINNLYIFNSDARATSGASINKVGCTKGFRSITPFTGLEDQGPTVAWTGDGTNSWRIAVPASYDSRLSYPAIILFHGNGSDETHWADNSNGRVVANAFLAAGYIVAGACYTANKSTWGNTNSQDAYKACYKYLRDNYNIGAIGVYANSMGGIESFNTIASGKLPGAQVWVGTSTTFSLYANYSKPDQEFLSVITAAYGIAADGSDYSSKTAGFDPALMPADSWGNLPIKILSATDDTHVYKTQNGDVLALKESGIAREVDNVAGITGDHSFNFAPYTSAMTAFFDKYCK